MAFGPPTRSDVPVANAKVWAEGHSWVILKGKLSDAQRKSAYSFLKFLWDNDFQSARTGHLPTSQQGPAHRQCAAGHACQPESGQHRDRSRQYRPHPITAVQISGLTLRATLAPASWNVIVTAPA